MFKRILIANRGEIAVRVTRACQELGIEAVAIYSDADKNALHVQLDDLTYRVGPADSAESYLNKEAVLEAAIKTKSEAIHPGYDFLTDRYRAPPDPNHRRRTAGPHAEEHQDPRPRHRVPHQRRGS